MWVYGSQDKVNEIEVSKSYVYKRTNIERVDENGFKGWRYKEKKVPFLEYVSSLASEDDSGIQSLMITMLMAEVDTLRDRIEKLEAK